MLPIRRRGPFWATSRKLTQVLSAGLCGFCLFCIWSAKARNNLHFWRSCLLKAQKNCVFVNQMAKAKRRYKMKNLITLTAAMLAFGVTATAMSAQSSADTDDDGLLSYNELLAAYPDLTEEIFTAIDTNADGALDADEMEVAQEAGLLPANN